jgi:hypothetical protein
MLHYFKLFIFIIQISFIISFIFRKKFEQKTRYVEELSMSSPMVIGLLYLFFPYIMFMFIPLIRRYRKRKYIEEQISYLKNTGVFYYSTGNKQVEEKYYDKLRHYERILKLDKIKSKTIYKFKIW